MPSAMRRRCAGPATPPRSGSMPRPSGRTKGFSPSIARCRPIATRSAARRPRSCWPRRAPSSISSTSTASTGSARPRRPQTRPRARRRRPSGRCPAGAEDRRALCRLFPARRGAADGAFAGGLSPRARQGTAKAGQREAGLAPCSRVILTALRNPAPEWARFYRSAPAQGVVPGVPAVLAPAARRCGRGLRPPVVHRRGRSRSGAERAGPGSPNAPDSPFEEFFHNFFDHKGAKQDQPGAEPRSATSLGSGFIVDPAGYIVTNDHVIAGADEITVILHDGTDLKAKVVGRDPKTDIALLKVNTKEKLVPVTWGDSDAARVGDWVLAIGNPFGLGGTVTAGILSARQRDIDAGPYDDFLQTDAPINRGNSGGPMFNMDGEVIGINTAIYSPSGGSIGIGFAIPS